MHTCQMTKTKSYQTIEYCPLTKKILGHQKMCEANEQDIEEELDSMIAKSPRWMRNLWRGSNITVELMRNHWYLT